MILGSAFRLGQTEMRFRGAHFWTPGATSSYGGLRNLLTRMQVVRLAPLRALLGRLKFSEANTMNESDEQAHEILWRLMKDIRFAMFTTHHANGHLHSRPMTTQNKSLEADGSLWFFMSRKGDPVADVEADGRVNLAYADPGADTYVSVSGEAKVVEDMAQKTALWNKFAQAWFPGGAGDPDLALVQVNIIHAHYWDVKSSKVVQLFKMTKAAITGEWPRLDVDSGEVRMNHGSAQARPG